VTDQDQAAPPSDQADQGGPPDDMPYEAARDELIEVVRRLEAGGTSLEESLALWERGERLAAICQRWLDGARARLAAATKTDEAEPDGE
jgi:exodeoxyribonuclease VII small subunit